MDRTKTTIFAALVIAIVCAPTASAQATAANMAIISGNGQMFCLGCVRGNFHYPYPFVVKVTDANGAPIAGKVVNWQPTFSPGPFLNVNQSSTTDSNGIAFTDVSQGNQTGIVANAFLQTSVLATADNTSATFYVTQALVDQNGGQLATVSLDSPQVGDLGYSLGSGPAGSAGTVPIKVHVSVFSNPIANVSLRLVNIDPTSAPSAVCATQLGADPGSVLTDATGEATCFPVFGSTPGSGTVKVYVGGLDPAQFNYSSTNQPLAGPLAYFELDGLMFTVSPVTAALVKVSSGNNQSINPGQTSNPLVVLVTDSTGSVPVANANIAWSITPAVGATLSTTSSASNASGLAQTSVTLHPAPPGNTPSRPP